MNRKAIGTLRACAVQLISCFLCTAKIYVLRVLSGGYEELPRLYSCVSEYKRVFGAPRPGSPRGVLRWVQELRMVVVYEAEDNAAAVD